MKIDNFTTARCKDCGWIKQFQPGKEYKSSEFECNCKEIVKPFVQNVQEVVKPTPQIDEEMEALKAKATSMGISFAHNISKETLSKKIEEAENGS